MCSEASLRKIQGIVHSAANDVEVLYGEGFEFSFAVTCCARLPGKLLKVHLTAKLLHNDDRPSQNLTQQPASALLDANNTTLSSTKQLAQFLAELSPQGGFDTFCLVNHERQSAAANAPQTALPPDNQSPAECKSARLQAGFQQASAGRANQSPWLNPAAAVFTNNSSSNGSSSRSRLLVFAHKTQHSLADVLRFSPQALQDDEQRRLVLFQVLLCLQSLHAQGRHLGNLTPDSIQLSPDRHLWVDFMWQASGKQAAEEEDLEGLTAAWCSKRMSNLDYLLHLNRLAGRRFGDRTFHPYLPWVLDMTQPPEAGIQEGSEGDGAGWRDLGRTKWRLSKGDEQLDFTYRSAMVPHHISDEAMSELAVCIYKARRLPKEVLVKVVRPQFQPQEYPPSLPRLYNWSPDEAIPELYTDPSVFESIHPELMDLAVPDWAQDPQDFVTRHRLALESDRVSDQLHQWIDLNFGYKLQGQAAIEAKNVALPAVDPTVIAGTGRPQLFFKPHPRRYAQATNLLATKQVKQLKPFQQLQMLESLHTKVSVHTNGRHPHSTANQHDDSLGQLNEPSRGAQTDRQIEDSHADPLNPCQSMPPDPVQPTSPANGADSGSAADGQQYGAPAEAQQAQHEAPGPAQDVAAFGRLVVQLYRGRWMYHSPSDHRFWAKEVSQLPCPCQALARTCLEPMTSHRPTAAALLDCDFFPQPVRTAAFFLAALHPVSPPVEFKWQMPISDDSPTQAGISLLEAAPWLLEEATGCSALAALAARAASGELAALQAQPSALCLCLPGFTATLSSTLDFLLHPPHNSPGDRRQPPSDPPSTPVPPPKGHAAAVQHWCAVVRVLVDILNQSQLHRHMLQLLIKPFSAQHSSASTAVRLSTLHLMPALFDKLGLDTYLTHFHPLIMHVVVTSADEPQAGSSRQGQTASQVAASFERAQLTNTSSTALCGVVSSKLTLPVVLEHVVRPLLLALGNSPDVAVALIGVGSAIGGVLAAVHVLPSLIMVLISSRTAEQGGEGQQPVPARRRASEGGRAAAGAMLNAVTALEGLLPILPKEAVRQQVIRARQVVVQAAVLAEAPSLSSAAAGGPSEETQPGLVVDMLLSPRAHPLATPQLRDRLAALLLQASKLVGGSEVVTLELLPQLVPLFLCPPDQRGAFGSSIPPAGPAAPPPIRTALPASPATAASAAASSTSSSTSTSSPQQAPASLQQRMQQALAADIAPGPPGRPPSNPPRQAGAWGSGPRPEADSAREDDTGFWDLVYILYPDFAEAVGVAALRELVPHWNVLERTLQARYAWTPPAVNPTTSNASSSGLLASLKDKVKRIRRTTSGASAGSPLAYQPAEPLSYSPPDDPSQRAALYMEGVGWSTPAMLSPRVAPGGPVGSSPLGRQSSIMPDWSPADDTTDQAAGTASGQGEQGHGQLQEDEVSLREGIDKDAESSVNSFLDSPLDGGLSPLLIEHESGASQGAQGAGVGGRRWGWLPVAPDAQPVQWANADIWEHPPGREESMWWQRPWRLRAAVVHGWRAHRHRLTAIAAHPNEHLVATAGRGHIGGQEQEVVRLWSLAQAAAGVQYGGHSSPITALCWLTDTSSSSHLIASCDAGGSLHVWSAATGAARLAFKEAPGNSSSGSTAAGSKRQAAQQTGWAQPPATYRLSSRTPTGPRPIRTTSAPASHPTPSPSSGMAVEGSSKSSSSLANALAQRPAGGFTTVNPGAGQGQGRDALAGTANGKVCWLDLQRGVLTADLYCRPLGKPMATGSVSALAANTSWLAAGLSSGHAAVLDSRAGSVVAFWKGHDASITALASIDDHCLLTASQDHTLKLWDLRTTADVLHLDSMPSKSPPVTAHATPTSRAKQSAGVPGCLAVFTGHTEAISGFAMQKADVIAHAGPNLGLISLQGPPYSDSFVPKRLTNARGGKDSASLVGLDILPHSRLLVAGTEDGIIKMCH